MRALKYFSVLFGAIILLLALLLATLSFTLPWVLQQVARGSDLDLEIETIDIDLTAGIVEISDATLSAIGHDPAIQVEGLVVDLSWQHLLGSRLLMFEDLQITGLRVPMTAELSPQNQLAQLSVAGIAVVGAPSDTPTGESDEVTAAEPPPVAFMGWQAIELQDAEVQVDLTRGEKTLSLPINAHGITLGAYRAIAADGDPVHQTDIEYAISIGKTDLAGSGRVQLPLPETGVVDFSFEAAQLADLQGYAGFFGVNAPVEIAGDLAIDTQVEWQSIDPVQLMLNASDVSSEALTLHLGTERQLESAGVQINLGGFNLDDQKFNLADLAVSAEEVEFRDGQYSQPLEIEMSRLSVALNHYRPGDVEEVSRLAVEAGTGRFGQFRLEGTGHVTESDVSGEFNVEAEQIELSRLNALTSSVIGQQIETGALDLILTGDVTANELASNAELELHQLAFIKAETEDEEVNEELGMPINTALNLLRDNDDTVRLSVPISGDIMDPDIKLGGIVNKAIMKGVRTAVVSQFAPLMVISAIGQVRSLTAALQLKPIEFETGAELPAGEAAQEQLKVIHELLNNRPKIKLNVCGVATHQDSMTENEPTPATGEEETILSDEQVQLLNELALNRAEHVKAALMEMGLDGKRLILCAPKIAEDADSTPHVDFSL